MFNHSSRIIFSSFEVQIPSFCGWEPVNGWCSFTSVDLCYETSYPLQQLPCFDRTMNGICRRRKKNRKNRKIIIKKKERELSRIIWRSWSVENETHSDTIMTNETTHETTNSWYNSWPSKFVQSTRLIHAPSYAARDFSHTAKPSTIFILLIH